MTGLAARTGGVVRAIRTGIELTVLGGRLRCSAASSASGTVLYALAIGPLVQFFLPHVAVRLPERAGSGSGGAVADASTPAR